MFFKKDPLTKKKDEIVSLIISICKQPMAQVNLELTTRQARDWAESLDHLSDDQILNTDAYLLAMAASINTARTAIKHDEFQAVCMISAAVMLSVGGRAGLSEVEVQAAKELAEMARSLLEKNRDKLDPNSKGWSLVYAAQLDLNVDFHKKHAENPGMQLLQKLTKQQ